jgi:hypothetical protein
MKTDESLPLEKRKLFSNKNDSLKILHKPMGF